MTRKNISIYRPSIGGNGRLAADRDDAMDDPVGRGFYRPERQAISTNRRARTHPNSERGQAPHEKATEKPRKSAGLFLAAAFLSCPTPPPFLPSSPLAHAPNNSATTSSCVNSPSPRLSPLTRPSCPRRALSAGARHRRAPSPRPALWSARDPGW